MCVHWYRHGTMFDDSFYSVAGRCHRAQAMWLLLDLAHCLHLGAEASTATLLQRNKKPRNPVAAVEKAAWFERSPSSALHQWPVVSHVIPWPTSSSALLSRTLLIALLSALHTPKPLKLCSDRDRKRVHGRIIISFLHPHGATSDRAMSRLPHEQGRVHGGARQARRHQARHHFHRYPIIHLLLLKHLAFRWSHGARDLIVSSCVAVWKELEKENKEFFQAYTMDQAEKAMEMEAAQRIQKMLAEWAAKDSEKED
ncbi:hypothetical protein GW17_00006638 [Ensete ventricosum]|nr:hypothetical protein GW17_00006638 [Ensete ventricosum]